MRTNGKTANGTGDDTQTQPRAPDKIVLVGMMGAGKSTLGILLGKRLGRPFLDVDAVIETEAGTSIPELFATEGEVGFRRRELDAFRRLFDTPDALVLAAGGGAFCQDAVRDLVVARARSVFLRINETDLLKRLAESDIAARPMLAGDAWRERVTDLIRARYPIYEKADVILDIAGDEHPEITADRLERLLNGSHSC